MPATHDTSDSTFPLLRRGISDCIRGFIHVSRGLRGASPQGGNDHCEVGLQSTGLCLRGRPLLVWLRVQRGPGSVCLWGQILGAGLFFQR